MEHDLILITAMVCVTLFLCVIVLVFGRLKNQKLETLRKLAEQGNLDQEQINAVLIPQERYGKDYRRGILQLGLGLTLGTLFFFVGGNAWMLAVVPVISGSIYLWFWWLNAKKK